MIRTTSKLVSFPRAFTVNGIEGSQSAGTYLVEIDEALIDGLSFSAYRRLSTRIHLPPGPTRPGITDIVPIEADEVDAALAEHPNE